MDFYASESICRKNKGGLMIMTNIFREYRKFYNKELPIPEGNEFMFSKILAFSQHILPFMANINHLIGQKLYNKVLFYNIPKLGRAPFNKYMKKLKIEEEFAFLTDELKKFYNISQREIDIYMPILLKQFQDKKALKEYMLFVGSNKKYFKKLKIDYKPEKKGGLSKWG